jgi:hypothetical protein
MTATSPPNALNATMAPLVSPDITLAIGVAGASLGVVQTANGPVPIVQDLSICLAQIVENLARVTTFASSDDNTVKAALQVMQSPFDSLSSAIAELLVPDPSVIEGDTNISDALQDTADQITDALTNPFSAVIQQQGAAVTSSFNQIQKILFNSQNPNSNFVDYFTQAKTAFKTLFLSSTSVEGNLAGLFIYAFDYGIPSIDAELAYLQAMKKAVNGVVESASKIPATLNLNLPNQSVIADLCDAELNLQTVSDRLRATAVFDRTSFNTAAQDVCAAKTLIFNGKFNTALLQSFSSQFLGVSGLKVGDLGIASFLPNIQLQLQIQELSSLGLLYSNQEPIVSNLWKNIATADAQIQNLAKFNSGDLIALLVDVIHRQISSLRISLQAAGGGGPTTITLAQQQSQVQSTINNNNLSPTQTASVIQQSFAGYQQYTTPPAQQPADISTYMSNQAATYLMLTVLCQLMEEAQSIYTILDTLINFETSTMKLILSIAKQFNVESCGNVTSGAAVTSAINAFISAMNTRLNSSVTNTNPVWLAANNVNEAITERMQFLNCMRNTMIFGSGRFSTALVDAAQLVSNIKNVAQLFPDLQQEIQSLNLANLTGTNGQNYSALTALVQGIQCLLLNCGNPLVQAVAKDTLTTFQQKLDTANSKVVTMASLDQVPTAAANARINNRINQVASVLASIQNILSLNIQSICSSDTPAAQQQLNQQRQSAPGTSFGSAPAASNAPIVQYGQSGAPSPGVQALQQAIIVNTQFFNPPPTAANPPSSPTPFANTNPTQVFVKPST